MMSNENFNARVKNWHWTPFIAKNKLPFLYGFLNETFGHCPNPEVNMEK